MLLYFWFKFSVMLSNSDGTANVKNPAGLGINPSPTPKLYLRI